jgi:2-dehydro-3-deoxyphosphogluconate aldolase/(4S)-4-hydroxy-2-oxoglutarate aldolase
LNAPKSTFPVVAERPPINRQLSDSGVVAILRADRDSHLETVAMALVESGISCLELTLTTPGALETFSRLRQRCDGVALGMGSVTTADQARSALDAGADFLVSPAVSPEVVEQALGAGVACYPGAWTPSEILAAWRSGASAVKLFPAESGGPRHLKNIHAPLPDIPLVPTGGVGLDAIAAYLAAGALAVGLGGPLIGDALGGGSLSSLRLRAVAALDAVAAGRNGR